MEKIPPDLAKKILAHIETIERRRLFIKCTAFGTLLAGSLGLVVYACFAVFADASHSGFTAFASLLFSDFSAATASFSDFMFSLAESFPLFSVTMFLSGIFFTLWSAARFMSEIAIVRKHTFSALA